jgi:ketosteroid isomerase-like protein
MSEELAALDLAYRMIWREGRLEEVVGAIGEDFEWVVPDIPDDPVRRGPEAVIEFFRDWMDRFEGLDVDWTLEDAGPDRVIAYIHMHGRGRGSGVPAEMRYAQVFTFDHGRPVRMVLYVDMDEARRATGLA